MQDTNLSVSSPKILLGSGRSGTTWIQDCLADANNLRPIFEPLHPGQSEIGSRYAYKVVTRGTEDERLEQLFRDPDAVGIAKRWTAHRTPRGLIYPKLSKLADREIGRRRIRAWRAYYESLRKNSHKIKRTDLLVKCIRANLMVDWLANRLNYTVAMIVRHPCSVVESQFRLGKIWDPRPVTKRYQSSADLHKLTDGRYESLLATKLSTIQALTLNWVIENQWPVFNAKSGGYSTVFYEDLLDDSKNGWSDLCQAMGLSNVPSQLLTKKPSQQSSRKDSKAGSHSDSPVWKKNLDVSKLGEIQGILDKTDCRLYSVEEICPL